MKIKPYNPNQRVTAVDILKFTCRISDHNWSNVKTALVNAREYDQQHSLRLSTTGDILAKILDRFFERNAPIGTYAILTPPPTVKLPAASKNRTIRLEVQYTIHLSALSRAWGVPNPIIIHKAISDYFSEHSSRFYR